jgi:hypothetical protein
MNFTFIILGIILVIVLWILYKYLTKPKSVIAAKNYLQNQPTSVALSTLTSANSVNYYYCIWIYVNNLNSPPVNPKGQIYNSGQLSGSAKTLPNNIFYVMDSNNNMYLSLDVNVNGSLSTNLQLGAVGNSKLTEYEISPNFPLQRWEYVVISVNQTYLDLYLDGKLIKSASLANTPTLPTVNGNTPTSIYFGIGDIYIAGFERVSNPMDPQTAWNNYMRGSGVNPNMTNYGLSMTLSKNNTPQSTVTLF